MLTTSCNQITEKLEDLHAPDDNATVETRWCQLRNVIQSTALEVLGRARRQHQDWFDENDADINNLLAEKNGLQCSLNHFQRCSTQKCENLCLPGRHAVTQHENRGRGCSTEPQNQSGPRVESPRYSPVHQTEDVQRRRLDDTPLRSRDLDHLPKPSQEDESLPSQLSP
ncbi:unnamed protein product [Schistocephalus solidus]|uniref:Uncharacterized protein n=1 Tax=Schistocephalus solidus TaxID=70667 RepID=A0A183TF18_SCHSO|nr:unnamed protein product [Schistocephalus solidus]